MVLGLDGKGLRALRACFRLGHCSLIKLGQLPRTGVLDGRKSDSHRYSRTTWSASQNR
jgi:hypothetical protein